MNDLERELKDLFDERARGVDTPVLAPEAVLRRGRRRQARTVVGGVLAGVVAVAVAVSAVAAVRRPDAVVPAGPNVLPARSTWIGGVPVTAQAGWTLVNDWPLAALLSTSSESCSFTATGVPVGPGTSDTSAVEGEQQPSPSCTTTPTVLPAGVPVLQLANFEIPLLETVCGLAENPAASVPNDGVAVYVADMNGVVHTDDLLAACPGSENVHDETVMTTFADKQLRTVYAAVIVAGPQASSSDIDVAHAYLDSLDGIRITPTAPASTPGPGYVLAAGEAGDQHWRLEAGIASFDMGSGEPRIGAALVTTDPDGAEGSVTQDPPAGGSDTEDTIQDFGDAGVVQWGTASPLVTGVDLVAHDGTATSATLMNWPDSLRNLPGADGGLDGSIWFAAVAARGEVRPTLTTDPTTATTASDTNARDRLATRETEGGGLVIYGNDLGHEWEIRRADGQIRFFVDGQLTPSDTVLSLATGGSTHIDVAGGTFVVGIYDPSVTSLSVAVDGGPTIHGRYLPGQTNLGEPASIWVLALPGSGTGIETIDSFLPRFTSWPTRPWTNGSVIAGGSDRAVSWALMYRDAHCIVLTTLGADAGDAGTSDCLLPWADLEAEGGLPMIGGVYGQTRATIAMVLTHRPETSVRSTDLTEDELQCVDIDVESAFAGTTMCVFPVEAGHEVTVAVDQRGDALGGPYRIVAGQGRINLYAPTPTASP